MSLTSVAATDAGPVSLTGVKVQLLSTSKTKARARRLLAKHHYLGDVRAVGEQLFYAVTDAGNDWLGVLVFCAASRRLRARPQRRPWNFPAWRRSRYCAGTCANTHPKWRPATSLPPPELNAAQWLVDNRAAWGIESGLHQRLDVSHRDDSCRVRLPKAMRLMGLFRRISNSLFREWRSRQKKPHHKTTTDFFTAMNAEHHRYAIRCLHPHKPSFQTAS